MLENFRLQNWIGGSSSIEKHLDWIKSALERHLDKTYVFVMGHHHLVTCPHDSSTAAFEDGMGKLQTLLEQYDVTAYMFGHKHTMGSATNNGVLYIQTGAGGKRERVCGGNRGWAKDNTFGFVHLQIAPDVTSVSFLNSNGTLLNTESSRRSTRKFNKVPQKSPSQTNRRPLLGFVMAGVGSLALALL
ncbi:hypothetical protein HDU91_004477 [Kappamyces sp. JEL0680]|nr:hypothetical protein HDU91_004477 [Kappamyces sp. JEL0680]